MNSRNETVGTVGGHVKTRRKAEHRHNTARRVVKKVVAKKGK
jgi:hypothetical protein